MINHSFPLLSALSLAIPLSILGSFATAQDQVVPRNAERVLQGRPCSPYANRAFPTQFSFGDIHAHTPAETARDVAGIDG